MRHKLGPNMRKCGRRIIARRNVGIEHDDGSSSSISTRRSVHNNNNNVTHEPVLAVDKLKAIMSGTSGGEVGARRGTDSGSRTSDWWRWEPKIQRVPQILRAARTDNSCYDPRMVSIGPYHHNKNKKLRAMEEHKKAMMRHYVQCSLKCQVEEVYQEVLDVITKARECYVVDHPENKNFSDLERFRYIMFVDGCFLVQYIISRIAEEENRSTTMVVHQAFLVRDLLLLENQLPFSVIKRLMQLKYQNNDTKIYSIIRSFIKSIWPSPQDHPLHRPTFEAVQNTIMKYAAQRRHWYSSCDHQLLPKTTKWDISREPMHLLQVIQMRAIDIDYKMGNKHYSSSRHKQEDEYSYRWRSATELKAAGIKFRCGKSHHLNDIHFMSTPFRGILTMTPMQINDTSEPILMNLVAFEALPGIPADQLVITSYLALLNSLIDHPGDVKELRTNGVIGNALGSDEQVAQLFNRITQGLSYNSQAFIHVQNGIDEHYKNTWKIWINQGLDAHFSSPWTITAFVAATCAIALSAIQTYYAAFPPPHPHPPP